MIESAPQTRHRFYWLLAALCVLAGAAVLAASWWRAAAPLAAHATATVGGHPPAAIGSGPWERVALPVPVADVSAVAVAPDDAATMYACSAHLVRDRTLDPTGPAPVMLWRTTDAGAHWTRYGPALASGTSCAIAIAPDDPARIGVQVLGVAARAVQGQPCSDTALYLSQDRGTTWRALPPHIPAAPAGARNIWCALQVTARHLFILTSVDVSSPTIQTTTLERSDDDGAHWVRSDTGLASGSLFSQVIVGRDDQLALLVYRWHTETKTEERDLLVSTDGGQTWHLESHPPEGIGTFLLRTEPGATQQWPTASQPFYALAGEQVPSDLFREEIFSSADGQGWDQVPALPVSGASDERRGVLQVLAALPDGRLAAWGVDPQAGVPAEGAFHEPATAFWLWTWDPAAQQWQVVPTPLAATQEEGCGLCWGSQVASGQGGTTYLYVANFVTTSLGPPPGIFRIRLPGRA